MAKKDDRQEALDAVQPFLAEWEVRSSGSGAPFRDWATYQILWDEGLSWEEVQLVTQIDGPGDKGIDGWYYASESTPPILYLIQSKDTKPVGDDLTKIQKALPLLFNPKSSPDANEEAKMRAQEFAERFRDDVTIEMHLVTSEIASSTLRKDADALGDDPVHILDRDIPCRVFVHDIIDLSEEIKVAHDRPIKATFTVPESAQFTHTTAGKYRTVALAVPGMTLVSLFARERTNLFRLNPRYYQTVRTGVNTKILETLVSKNERINFFMLNNGITAVCDGLRPDIKDGRAVVTAENFQIVNGCQTTATLYEAWKKAGHESALSGVEVLLRIIEAPPAIAPTIARTTNAQNPMKAEDSRANNARQQQLHDQFLKLDPPWFYEHKRGVWATEYAKKKVAKAPFVSESGLVRRIEMKDLAQACLAFIGRSADAIDRTRSVFLDDKEYDKVFPPRHNAQQFILPYLLFLQADAETTKMKAQGLTWAPYLRYPLTAAVSQWMHEVLGVPLDKYLPTSMARTLAESIDDWAPRLMPLASKSLSVAGVGARALVRQATWLPGPYSDFRSAILRDIENDDSWAAKRGEEPADSIRSLFPLPIQLEP